MDVTSGAFALAYRDDRVGRFLLLAVRTLVFEADAARPGLFILHLLFLLKCLRQFLFIFQGKKSASLIGHSVLFTNNFELAVSIDVHDVSALI